MEKHSPWIELRNAKYALRQAEERCPHWDYESAGSMGYDCCREMSEAESRVHVAREAVRRHEKDSTR